MHFSSNVLLIQYKFLLLILVAFPWALIATPIMGGHIVNTVGVTPKFPYIVSLQDRVESDEGSIQYKHFCGGSLIKSTWILTAAHCVWRKNIQQVFAVIGQENISNFLNFRRYEIAAVEYINFRFSILRNDIALLRLKQPYQTPYTPELWPSPINGSQIYAKLPKYGMKANKKTGQTQSNLHEGKVHVISNKKCQNLMGHIWAPQNGENKVCALGGEQDACQGDSGGPLTCSYDGQDYIYGIVSHGMSCGSANAVGVYTVTIPYLEWINSVINH